MSCAACEEIRASDSVAPPCEGPAECPVPPLGPREARVLRMRASLVRLGGLVDPATVLGTYGATQRDMELLEALQEELASMDEQAGEGGAR